MNNTITSLIVLATSLISCSKNSGNAPGQTSYSVIGKSWLTYDYSRNGTTDATVIAQKPTFEFRGDGKLYFSQIGPVYKDTFQYQLIDASNIKLTKPWLTTASINFKVDKLDDTSLDFTSTDSQTAKVDRYKTQKQ